MSKWKKLRAWTKSGRGEKWVVDYLWGRSASEGGKRMSNGSHHKDERTGASKIMFQQNV